MTLLQKYHSQTMPKALLKELDEINKKFGYKYPQDLIHYLKLLMIRNSIAQKESFEFSFESFRNQHLDMWDNLSFKERNKLFQLDFQDKRDQLHTFEYEGERIYIPIFDILFNNLYDRETVILELPQYFKLAHEFKNDIIDPVKFGLLPYAASFCYPCLGSRSDSVIMFDEDTNIFYRLNDQAVAYPLLKTAQIAPEHAVELARALEQFKDYEFIDLAMEYGYCHSKFIKKVQRKRK